MFSLGVLNGLQAIYFWYIDYMGKFSVLKI